MGVFRRVSVLVLLLAASASWGDELADLKARNAQLEATVEELTLQLAESVKARRALEAQLAQAATSPAGVAAPVAISEGQPEIIATEPVGNAAAPAVASRSQSENGCDVDYALQRYSASSKHNEQFQEWLEADKRYRKCSSDQLQVLRKAVRWDFWGYSREITELIDRELASRQ